MASTARVNFDMVYFAVQAGGKAGVVTSIALGKSRLYTSSRPGYPYPLKINPSVCYEFVQTMRENKVSFCALLLTIPEVEQYYDLPVCLCFFYKKNGIECLHYPITEGSIPEEVDDFDSLMRTVWNQSEKGNVLVHCSNGGDRTGMVAAGLQIYKGEKPASAIERARSQIWGAMQSTEQERFLKTYVKGRDIPHPGVTKIPHPGPLGASPFSGGLSTRPAGGSSRTSPKGLVGNPPPMTWRRRYFLRRRSCGKRRAGLFAVRGGIPAPARRRRRVYGNPQRSFQSFDAISGRSLRGNGFRPP